MLGAIAGLFSRKPTVHTNICLESDEIAMYNRVPDAEKTDEDRIFDLLTSQNSRGLFTGKPSEEIKASLGKGYHTETMRTIEILLMLTNQYAEYSDLWRRAYKKAIKALAGSLSMTSNQVKELLAKQAKAVHT